MTHSETHIAEMTLSPMKKPILQEMIRFRLSGGLKKRTKRIAKARQCADSDVAREGLMIFLDQEEKRLGLAKPAKV